MKIPVKKNKNKETMYTLAYLRKKLAALLIGKPLNPLNPQIHKHIALIAFLAWIGLGADGLSSSCYGPEEAYLALAPHYHLALYIALAISATIFIISLCYNQVITLFPSGGGGYRIATVMLGPHVGLISGCALIVDYVLTITVSIVSSVDALFSLLSPVLLPYKMLVEIALILILMALNLRGIKESIKILMPIFLGFVVVHIALIIYGIAMHKSGLSLVFTDTIVETKTLTQQMGWLFVIAIMLQAYSLGSSTYTGIEAVSNNVGDLAEPRVRTGKWTMFYMATSLSVTAGGIILLYLLWQVQHIEGQTLNATVFHAILGNSPAGHFMLTVTLVLEASLLFVAANTGFLVGPNVLSNMAMDNWIPRRFRHLSSRLTIQNGIIVFGIAALLILFLSAGKIKWLVVLYSINVFLTFSLSILSLCRYYLRQKQAATPRWRWRLGFVVAALMLTISILIITIITKFTAGGWITLLVTGIVIGFCLIINKHYKHVDKKIATVDAALAPPLPPINKDSIPLLPNEPCAVVFVNEHLGMGVHTLLWIQRMFPGHFKNFIFLRAGVVDTDSFKGKETLAKMQKDVVATLDYFTNYCLQQDLAAKTYAVYGTDPVAQLTALAKKINRQFPSCIFFATSIIFKHETLFVRMLHNSMPSTLQKHLHELGMQLVILPMRVNT
ncbi:APC family permease [soil metagenome]